MSGLSDTLRQLRHAQGRTLANVAQEAGMSQQYLCDIERGRRATPDHPLEVVNRVLACYGMVAEIVIRPIAPTLAPTSSILSPSSASQSASE